MKKRSKTLYSKEFFKGNYEQIVSITVDCEKVVLPHGEIHWVIGALSFLGRIDEAQKLFDRYYSSFSIEERVAARFFLAITLTRHTRYEEGRALFGENLRESRKKCSAFGLFFIEQGIGFYRYFSGRPRVAALRAGRAYAMAMEADFLYGRVLSLDLQGHAAIESSEVEVGLQRLNHAQKLAKKCGNGSVLQSLENSVLLYRLQFGFGGEDSIQNAEKKLEKMHAEDTYTESSILLELSRQYILRGNCTLAKKNLDRASRVIFSTQNRRHEIILNLRFAELLRREGDFSQSLNYIRSARNLLHLGIDVILYLEVIELEFRVSTLLQWKDRVIVLKKEALKSFRFVSGSIAERALRRTLRAEKFLESRGGGVGFKRGVDPVGDLMDSLVDSSEEVLTKCIDFGFYGLLSEALKLPSHFTGIYFDLIPGSVTFFDRGNVSFKKSIPPQTRKLMECLFKKECTKEDLIHEIWGYPYHPLRHDALVYQAMNQLRKFFGDFSDWIMSLDSSYHFKRGFQMMTYGHDVEPIRMEIPSTIVSTRDSNFLDLNLRQIKIVKIARLEESVDVRSLVSRFKVSALTLSRDFSTLVKKGLLIRVGKGRSTQYIAATKKEKLVTL